MFSITEANEGNIVIDDITYKKMKIKIADYEESFLCSLGYWQLSDYEKQWKEQLLKFKNKELDRAFFITEMYNPVTANFIRWWIIYRINDVIYIQEQMLFLNELNDVFSLENASTYIPERETIDEDEDGDKISEWKLSSDEFRNSFIIK